MDLLVSSIALVLLAPLMVAVAILVTADSPGPVLDRQERVGRGGRKFRLLSFRTTVNGSDVTRIGTTLRRYAIDEFPRLWNVFVGDISLVILWRAAQTVVRPAGAH
jgi:lipopolysaccharide/colanic/teichoic acid biosynthesis glycosyltransferase